MSDSFDKVVHTLLHLSVIVKTLKLLGNIGEDVRPVFFALEVLMLSLFDFLSQEALNYRIVLFREVRVLSLRDAGRVILQTMS